jgi:hypothetical protein
MSQSNREQLQQIAALMKAGKKAEASKMLVPILKTDPNNAAAWWLMANAVSDSEHKKRALKRFLQFRPGDEKATAMLAKLEPPVEDDPFSDLDNPFVAAAQTSVPARRKSFLTPTADDDNPFGSAQDDDNPFADSPKSSTPDWMNSTRSQPKPKRDTDSEPFKSNNSSYMILGGVIVAALIAIGAAVLIVNVRNSGGSAGTANASAGVDENIYYEPEVDCHADIEFNVNEDEGVRLPSRLIDLGAISFGETVEAFFQDGTEEHGYTFDGEAGQWVVIEMWATEFDPDYQLDPLVEIYDPEGHQFALCDDRASDNWDVYMEVRLPRNGVYTIVAKRYEYNDVMETYRLSLESR